MAYIDREKVCEICNNKGVDCGKEKCPVYKVPAANVVPRAEVDNWYQLYHSIKEELKQEKMYHRETDKLCDRYYIESQQAKKASCEGDF